MALDSSILSQTANPTPAPIQTPQQMQMGALAFQNAMTEATLRREHAADYAAQAQQRQMDNEKKQREDRDVQMVHQVLAQSTETNTDGSLSFNHAKAASQLASLGRGDLGVTVSQAGQAEALKKIQDEVTKQGADASRWNGLAQSTRNSQDTWNSVIDQGVQEGHFQPEVAQKLKSLAYNSPEAEQIRVQAAQAADATLKPADFYTKTAEQLLNQKKADAITLKDTSDAKAKDLETLEKTAKMAYGAVMAKVDQDATPDVQAQQYAAALQQAKSDYNGNVFAQLPQKFGKASMQAAEARFGIKRDKEPEDKNPTEVTLALTASDSSKTPAERASAEAALKRLDQSKREARPVTNVSIPALSTSANSKLAGDDYLATLPPGLAGQIKAIASGKTAIPPAGSRAGNAQAIRQAVFQYDPTYNDQRKKLRDDYESGKTGTNNNSMNTAIVHLDDFAKAADAINNGNFRPGNALYNSIASTFGSPKPNNLDALKAVASAELARALTGTATVDEIHSLQSQAADKNSPDQLKGWMKSMMGVIADKLNTVQEKFRQQIPTEKEWTPVLPSARKVLDRNGIKLRSEDGGGATQQATLPASAVAQLKKKIHTTFGNGQVWTLDDNGNPTQIK